MGEPWILGVAASHNGAACLLHGDRIVCAVQEERLTRRKWAKLVPRRGSAAVDHVLAVAGITASALDRVVVCPLFDEEPAEAEHRVVGHHRAHAIGAFASSGFEEAAVLVVDGMGMPASRLGPEELAAVVGPREGRETTSIYLAGEGLRPLYKQLGVVPPRPADPAPRMMGWASLGLMFQAVAQQIFGRWFDAGKVMGLAPYGEPRFEPEAFFSVEKGHLHFHDEVSASFRHDRRYPDELTAYRDLARSTQEALEEGMLFLAQRARELTGCRRLCLAGGVALNSVANERIVQSGLFDEVFIMPAAHDAGTALGAAFEGLWQVRGFAPGRRLNHDSHGRRYPRSEVRNALADAGLAHDEPADSAARAAELLAEGKVVAWFEGGSELGPRALGHRSILLDPRRADGKDLLNGRVKHREPFRPFAPAVLEEEAADWFDFGTGPATSPFMLRVCPVRPAARAAIPAVVHVDGTARVQTVSPGSFAQLIRAFRERTGVPLVLNTSFNVAGEPLVESPEDAIACFMTTGIDALVIEGCVVTKVGLDEPAAP